MITQASCVTSIWPYTAGMCLVSQAACCSHHHLSTSRSTYSLLHLCSHIISSNLIVFFNRGLTYLTGHYGKWINLHVHRRIIHPPWFSDAIEHKGFIYAVDSFYGWTYCWPTPVIATNGCYSSMLLSYDIMMACLYYCQHLLKKYSCS